jgi:hypothetical protein
VHVSLSVHDSAISSNGVQTAWLSGSVWICLDDYGFAANFGSELYET